VIPNSAEEDEWIMEDMGFCTLAAVISETVQAVH